MQLVLISPILLVLEVMLVVRGVVMEMVMRVVMEVVTEMVMDKIYCGGDGDGDDVPGDGGVGEPAAPRIHLDLLSSSHQTSPAIPKFTTTNYLKQTIGFSQGLEDQNFKIHCHFQWRC